MPYRTGIGYDVHRFKEGRKLMLGGIEVPHHQGLDGHSDADVVLHAICDALLGAIGRGDIGEHFPPGDSRFKDISSTKLLKMVQDMVMHAGYSLINIDVAILAEEPHLKDYKLKMRTHIANELALEENRVNIKATTNEGMGFIGNKEGIAAYATALIAKKI
jgi:2-C-methyl-D-erythritol 2,4-cyclodiphosphate synthase